MSKQPELGMTASEDVILVRKSERTKHLNEKRKGVGCEDAEKRVIVHGLMAAPNCPWGQKRILKSKLSRFGGEVKICVDDISEGKESIAIRAVNMIDDEKPAPFGYITSMMYPDYYYPIPLKGCACTARCLDSDRCCCAVSNGGEIPYNRNGAIIEAKPLVYECGPCCKCPPSCWNRASQHGIKFQLEIFKTESRGWGVRALNSIPSGSFVCEYLGELLEEKEAEERNVNDEYLFDVGRNCNDDKSSCGKVVEFTIDAARYGNVARFINHSCSPNLYAQDVLYDQEDKRIPHVMLFATQKIPPLQELTYDYNYKMNQVLDCNGNIKMKNCYCGSSECTGRMY